MSYRPVELRAFIEQAKVERRPARIQDVKWQRPGTDTVWFEIHVNPLVDSDNGLLGVSIVFFDVTATRALLDKVVQTNRRLETAYECSREHGDMPCPNDGGWVSIRETKHAFTRGEVNRRARLSRHAPGYSPRHVRGGEHPSA